jgi:uncharacterized NAD(P)/FAD-binding protein YdhS
VLDGGSRTVTADRVVACIGAQEDVTAVRDPLVASLMRSGDARPRRGDLYETTAIPEIREQAAALADLLIRRAAPALG